MANVVLVAFLSLISFSICAQSQYTGNLNLFIGAKKLNEKDLLSNEEQGEIGFVADFRRPKWPVSIAIDFLVASEATNYLGGDREYESSSRELGVGLRKYVEIGDSLRPYIGGGVARTTIEYSTRYIFTHSTEGSGTGYWVGAGVVWSPNNINIGIDIRRTEVDVEIDSIPRDAGGNHVGIIAGIHW